jgi:hypothetical protein
MIRCVQIDAYNVCTKSSCLENTILYVRQATSLSEFWLGSCPNGPNGHNSPTDQAHCLTSPGWQLRYVDSQTVEQPRAVGHGW